MAIAKPIPLPPPETIACFPLSIWHSLILPVEIGVINQQNLHADTLSKPERIENGLDLNEGLTIERVILCRLAMADKNKTV
ncbi:MAG: hypothetical protein ACU0CA_01560 [Paracoccaceae bacterium]